MHIPFDRDCFAGTTCQRMECEILDSHIFKREELDQLIVGKDV